TSAGRLPNAVRRAVRGIGRSVRAPVDGSPHAVDARMHRRVGRPIYDPAKRLHPPKTRRLRRWRIETMKRPLIALAAATVLGATATPAFAESLSIPYQDLNLSTAEGQQ